MSKKFFSEVISKNSLDNFKKLNKVILIISVRGSCDKEAKKYFGKVKNKKESENVIIENTDHQFTGALQRKELFNKTFRFINKLN